MSSPPRDPLKMWADSVVPVEDAQAAAAREGKAIERLRDALRQVKESEARNRRSSTKWLVLSAAAIAAVSAAALRHEGRSPTTSRDGALAGETALGFVRIRAGTVRTVHEGRSRLASAIETPELPLASMDEIATLWDGEAGVGLVNGTTIGLRADTRIRVAGTQGDEVGLDLGTIRVDVPKLAPGHTFRVRTPNAVVTVHGTAFSVAVSGDDGSMKTKVAVTEGVVSVRCNDREDLLYAGSESLCPFSAPERSADTVGPPARPMPHTPESIVTSHGAARAERGTLSSPASAERVSDLAEQNRLLAAAMECRKQGDDSGAVRMLDEFSSKFPASLMLEVARVERFRALERAGRHAEAAKDARRYLATYRDGFAREEARKLALNGLPSTSSSR